MNNVQQLKSSSFSMKNEIRSYSTLLALLAVFIFLGMMTQGGFLEARNFTNLTRQISVNGILAIGMTLVILTGGIDLSVGSVVALCGVVMGLMQVPWGYSEQGPWGTFLSILLGVGVGSLCGLINGSLIAYLKIPPFIISLGMMVVARGVALIISNSSAISPMSESFVVLAKGFVPAQGVLALFLLGFLAWAYFLRSRYQKWQARKASIPVFLLGIGLELFCFIYPAISFYTDRGIPFPTLMLLLLAAFFLFLLNSLPLGRYIYALGGNEEAAYLSGVPTKKVKIVVYTLMGFLSGLCGMILTARLNSATPTEGNLMELDAIAAVVIGGTSLSGGQGTLVGSILGAFLIGTLNNGMDLLGIDSNYQMVVKGLIIILAVWSDARAEGD